MIAHPSRTITMASAVTIVRGRVSARAQSGSHLLPFRPGQPREDHRQRAARAGAAVRIEHALDVIREAADKDFSTKDVAYALKKYPHPCYMGGAVDSVLR